MPPFGKKRVHKPAAAAANDAARLAGFMYCPGLFLQIRPPAVKKPLADGYCHRQKQEGTLIHNGIAQKQKGITARNTRFLTLSPGTLAVVPVKSPFGCLVVAQVGRFQLTKARDSAATVTAIALPVITTAADVEMLAAFRKPTNQLNQYYFGVFLFAHISPEGGTGQTPRFMSAFYPLIKVQNLNSLRGSFGHRALTRLVPSSLLFLHSL
jgi:hypothetical protein